jgi:uncharacterized membrane protein YcaP (DUF421 family)
MEIIHLVIGSDSQTISWWQMVIRAVFLFFYTVAFLRIGGKQAFGKRTVYDLVIAVILGSTLSRILTANARFFPSIAALTSLLILHILVSRVSFYNKIVEHWFKGGETRLVADGEFLWPEMKRAGITPHDILEALRLNASTQDLSQVKEAYLERSGKISIIKK